MKRYQVARMRRDKFIDLRWEHYYKKAEALRQMGNGPDSPQTILSSPPEDDSILCDDCSDPLWTVHDLQEDLCPGCPICEFPVQLFRELPDGTVLLQEFHPACFKQIVE